MSVFPTCFKHNKWGYFNQMKKEIELEYSVSNIRNYIVMVCGSFLTDEINKIVKIRQDPNVKPAISMMAKLKANSASGVFGMESERKQKTKVLYDPVLSDDKKAKVSDIKAYYSPLTINDDIVSEAIIDNRKRKQMGSHFCSMYDEVPFDVRVDDRITRSNVKRLKIWNDCAEKSVFKGFVEEIPLNCKVKSLIPINTKILAESKINVGLFYKRIFDDFKKCGVTVFNCYTDTDSLKMMFYRDGDSNNNDFLNFVLDKLKADYADKIDFSNIKKHPHYDGRFKKNLGFWQHENGSDTNGYNTIQSLVATAPKSYHVVYLNKSIERKAKGVKAAVDIPIKHYLDNFVDVSCYYNAIKSDSDLSNEKPENSNEKDYSLNDKIESHHNKLSLCHENIVSNQKNMKTNRISQHQFKNSLTADIKIQEIEKKTFASITNKTYRLGKRGELSIIHGHPILKDIMQYLKSLNSDELFSDETIRKQYLMEQDMINNSSYLTKWVKFFSEYTSSFIGYHTDEDDVTIRLSEQYARDLESDGE